MNCVRAYNTYQWQPGKVTTFVLPVIDIELLIDKLSNIATATSLSDTERVQVTQQVKNWQKVLSTYRSHNTDLTRIFSADNSLFLTTLTSFKKFKAGGISESDFLNAFDSFLGTSDLPGRKVARQRFHAAFDGLSSVCSVAVSSSNSYVKSTCLDFSDTKADYKDLYGLLSSACDLPGSPDAGDSNPLKNSVLLQGLCRQGSVGISSTIPGGFADSDTSNELMGFLKSNTKYITYSSNAPTTLTWTSTVTDSLSVSANEDATAQNEGSVDGFIDGDVFGATLHGIISAGGAADLQLSVGKTSDSTHDFTRTVTINLDDNDLGECNY